MDKALYEKVKGYRTALAIVNEMQAKASRSISRRKTSTPSTERASCC